MGRSADLDVRRYVPDDHDRIWELHEQALRDVDAFSDEFTHRDIDLDEIPETYLNDGGEFLVGEVDSRIVAMGALQGENATTGQIRRMRVDPAHQRQGFGSTILRTLKQVAKESGYEKLILDTTRRQTAARNFYRKHGYRELGRKQYPDVGLEMIFYEKEL